MTITHPLSFAAAVPLPFRAPDSLVFFIPPLMGENPLEPGVVFPRHEITRRVLSFFWRDCCCPTCFSRAPAPVVELSGASTPGVGPLRVLAWWLLNDGIFEETEGPGSSRLRAYFGGGAQPVQLWPRYEFRVREQPFQIDMALHHDRHSHRGIRTCLEARPDGGVRVVRQESCASPCSAP
jgi:hypothetical protein